MNNQHLKIVLIGNPNTGKTSLLNSLTGMSLHVGNWPGKTVEKKEGYFSYQAYNFEIVDLPGTYSIAPYSEEEKVTYDYLNGIATTETLGPATCGCQSGGQQHQQRRHRRRHGCAVTTAPTEIIVQTIDVNALERNLLMTMELLALGKRIVLAFNFNREAKRRGIEVKIAQISQALQVPVVAIEANKGENNTALLEAIIETAHQPVSTPDYITKLLKENKEIHHDETLIFLKDKIRPHYLTEKANFQTERIDAVLLNRYTAFPVFIAIMFLMFTATFTLATPLVDAMDNLFNQLGQWVELLKLTPLLQSLLIDGVIAGVGSVMSFAPLIFVLFLLIALLEDSGYLGRTVVLVDKIFSKFGISGRSFIPMILGFGCNVPAIMATRTIKDQKERKIAILINSFMSCGARLPVYVLFSSIFFPDQAIFVIMLLYASGVLVAFLASWVISRFIKSNEEHSLIIELPPYRMPSLRNILKHAWYHTGEFMKKAGTIILGSVFIIWLLSSLPVGVEYGSEASLVGRLGKFIAPIFQPLGFGEWTFAIALIFGFVAKEVIIGTLATIHGGGEEALSTILPGIITPLGAFAFLFFVLLYVPCIASLAVVKKETGKWRYVFLQILLNTGVAWLISWLIFTVGKGLGY